MNRANAITENVINAWFDMCSKKIADIETDYKQPIPASNIWNTDESGFCCDQGQHVILCRKG